MGNLTSNGCVNFTVYLFSRPLTSFARQAQTNEEYLPPRPAEAKTEIPLKRDTIIAYA
jgi:hypothetical protein